MPALIALLLAASQAVAAEPPLTFLSGPELLRVIGAAPAVGPPEAALHAVLLPGPSGPVVAIRRTGTGESEVHREFADVWYVLEGEATLVTGGSIAEGRETGPGEIRGRGVSGGDSRVVRKGDFAFVPAGVPHWISRVAGKELLYLVVKVPAARAAAAPGVRADDDQEVAREIKALELHLADLLVRGDIDSYSTFLSEDYTRINDRGEVQAREQVLQQFRAGPRGFTMEPTELAVESYGDTAILTGVLKVKAADPAMPERTSRFRKVFVHRGGRWYLVSLQGVPYTAR